MFTGIVEAVGRVREVVGRDTSTRIRLATSLGAELSPGDSLAVNGVCLTVVERDANEVAADVGPETARVTNLSTLSAGQAVNLERPLRLGGRLDGHLVQGHVDGVGRVEQTRSDGDSHWVTISYPAPLSHFFIHKGSVAVDGVSLTIAALRNADFDVQIVPYTWSQTTFGVLRIGDIVNLECDMIGKYVVRALGERRL